MTQRQRVEFGDWQTPSQLADAALATVSRAVALRPAAIVEPTCGLGSFLCAAATRFPKANLYGYDINPDYIRSVRAALPRSPTKLDVANFFDVDWDEELRDLPEPILVVGNPPWVTSATLGSIGAKNLPRKDNFKKLNGLDARTGKSNFDVSEWMLLRLLEVLQGRDATVAVLAKAGVARRVIEFAASRDFTLAPLGIWRIDALAHFGASVDAVLFAFQTTPSADRVRHWPVFSALDEPVPQSHLGLVGGILASDVSAFTRTQYLAGVCKPEWRSGVKHDCSTVMELSVRDGRLVNGLDEDVDIEEDLIYPLLKSSDLANGRLVPRKKVVVPQTTLGQDTGPLKVSAPNAWAYLTRHCKLLAARKSSIYRGQPPFAIFGIGGYSFAPWKVAISGLYKRLEFCLLGPMDGRPVLVDDTCYFLPFDSERDARMALAALQSKSAHAYLSARIFWDAKRPIGKVLLQGLDLLKLGCAFGPATAQPPQQAFAF